MNTFDQQERLDSNSPSATLEVNRARTLRWMCVSLMCVSFVAADSQFSHAQEYAAPQRGRVSALAKLDRFQRTVKEKIKSALIGDDSEDSKGLPLDQQGPHDSIAQTPGGYDPDPSESQSVMQSADSVYADGTFVGQNSIANHPPAYGHHVKPEPGGLSRQVSNRRAESNESFPRVATIASAEQDVSMEDLLRGNETRPVQYEQDAANGYGIGPYGTGEGDNEGVANFPPPIRTQPLINNAAGNPTVPSARGTILGSTPMTATQHALRLIEENGDLKANLASSNAEVERLREKLASTNALLQSSTDAVAKAQEEMDRLTYENRQLERKLAESESKYNRYLRETDRMLESIREELDEVLVRELSAGTE
ncbi:hypothetical protein [Rhodopirellula sp. MGV]|uniref:hypothetical protein n=1 Tax=Rhodopirellula sp. MGV TaxID=2023130 RepID=UPI00117A0AC3|nr:hypothetical protein [Rhodopirellula sp. MGV]